MRKNPKQFIVPFVLLDIVDQSPRCVGCIGRMHFAAGQAPYEERIDCAGKQFAAFGALAGAFHFVEQPCDFCAGEIRVEQQPRLAAEFLFQSGFLQFFAEGRRAPVLPYNRVVDGLAGSLIPDHDGFALVGDADRSDVRRGATGFLYGGLARRDDGCPDLFRIVLDPTGGRIILSELLLGESPGRLLPVKQNCARRGCALIKGKDKVRHRSPVLEGGMAGA